MSDHTKELWKVVSDLLKENKQLKEVNAELLEACKLMASSLSGWFVVLDEQEIRDSFQEMADALEAGEAAIAKAKEKEKWRQAYR